MISQEELHKMGWCWTCSMTCQKIGEINRIGVKKSYCCPCYAKIDPNFTQEHWCAHCKAPRG